MSTEYQPQALPDDPQADPVQIIRAYWRSLSAHGALPARADVDPRGLGTALQNAFILECAAPRLARIRVSGSLVNTVLGMDLRGMPAHCLFAADARKHVSAQIEDVFARQQSATFTLGWDTVGWDGATDVRPIGQMVILPLTDDKGRVTRALGALSYTSRVGYGIARFRPLASAIDPVGGTLRATGFPHLAVDNPCPQTRGAIRAEPALRIVKSD